MTCPKCNQLSMHLAEASPDGHWYCVACSLHFDQAILDDEGDVFTMPNDQYLDIDLPMHLRQFEGKYRPPRSSSARKRRPKVKLVLIQGGKS